MKIAIATGFDAFNKNISEGIQDIYDVDVVYFQEFLLDNEFDIVILSKHLKGERVISKLIFDIKCQGKRIIFLSSEDEEDKNIIQECIKYGVHDILFSNITPDRIVEIIKKPMQLRDVSDLMADYVESEKEVEIEKEVPRKKISWLKKKKLSKAKEVSVIKDEPIIIDNNNIVIEVSTNKNISNDLLADLEEDGDIFSQDISIEEEINNNNKERLIKEAELEASKLGAITEDVRDIKLEEKINHTNLSDEQVIIVTKKKTAFSLSKIGRKKNKVEKEPKEVVNKIKPIEEPEELSKEIKLEESKEILKEVKLIEELKEPIKEIISIKEPEELVKKNNEKESTKKVIENIKKSLFNNSPISKDDALFKKSRLVLNEIEENSLKMEDIMSTLKQADTVDISLTDKNLGIFSIAGIRSNIGVTHLSLLIAFAAKNMGVRKVAIVEDNNGNKFSMIENLYKSKTSSKKFRYKGVDFYKHIDSISSKLGDYDLVVVDNGEYKIAVNKQIFRMAQRKIIVADSNELNYDETISFCKSQKSTYKDYLYALPFATDNEMKKFMKFFEVKKVVGVPIIKNIFNSKEAKKMISKIING